MASDDLRRAAEHDAGRVLHRFFHCLDDGRYEELASLMAARGVWHRQGKALQGPDGVLAAMQERPAGLVTRHLITNLLMEASSPDLVRATFYATVFAHAGAPDAAAPAPMEVPLQVAVYRETLSRDPEGWRIAEIASTQCFRRQA